MYGRNFKAKIFTDITMPAKLFVAQILARVPEITNLISVINLCKKLMIDARNRELNYSIQGASFNQII